jgi:hypothetical protein
VSLLVLKHSSSLPDKAEENYELCVLNNLASRLILDRGRSQVCSRHANQYIMAFRMIARVIDMSLHFVQDIFVISILGVIKLHMLGHYNALIFIVHISKYVKLIACFDFIL